MIVNIFARLNNPARLQFVEKLFSGLLSKNQLGVCTVRYYATFAHVAGPCPNIFYRRIHHLSYERAFVHI